MEDNLVILKLQDKPETPATTYKQEEKRPTSYKGIHVGDDAPKCVYDK